MKAASFNFGRRLRAAGCGGIWCIAVWLLIPGCQAGGWSDPSEILIELPPAHEQPPAEAPMTVETNWSGRKLWQPGTEAFSSASVPTIDVHFTFVSPDQTITETHVVKVDRGLVGQPQPSRDPQDGGRVWTLDQPSASLTLIEQSDRAALSTARVKGVCRVTLERELLDAAQATDPDSSLGHLLILGLLGSSGADVRNYSQLYLKPSMDQIIELLEANVGPTDIQSLHLAGYNFDVNDLLSLRAAQVPAAYAIHYKAAGFDYDAQTLIRLYRANISPGYASAMHRLGLAGNVDDMIALHMAGVTPEDIEAYHAAGYKPSPDEAIMLRQRGVRPQEALALRQSGYNLSLEDLKLLRRWNVSTPYALALISEDFEPLSADQLVQLHIRRITPDMVLAVRRGRGMPAPVAEASSDLTDGDISTAAPRKPALLDSELKELEKALR